MNVTSFVTFGSTKGTEKKGRKSSTVRRKEGRNSKVPPVDIYVNRPFAKSGAVGSTVNTTLTVTPMSTQSTGSVQQSVCIHPQTQPVPLKPGHSIPNPPNDMTVVSRMQRIFILPASGERVSREGNVYFHLHVNCIRTKQPFFQPNMVVVPRWVANLLSTQHKILLREFGVSI